MNFWLPGNIWEDQACYIIGGGPSLKEFNWDSLIGLNVIGCNVAFYMGAKISPITVFGDTTFLERHRSGLDTYANEGGEVITSAMTIDRFNPPSYLKIMKRTLHGLSKDGLGWNYNTGSLAINLALIYGAKKIYLLGYDMQLNLSNEKNYHNAYNDKARVETYIRFLKQYPKIAEQAKWMFPGQEIINLEDGTSALNSFPKESLQSHFKRSLQDAC